MRIYEFSKIINIPSSKLILLLKEEGFSVKNHMSVIDQKAQDFLNKKIKKEKDLEENSNPEKQAKKIMQTEQRKIKKKGKKEVVKKKTFQQKFQSRFEKDSSKKVEQKPVENLVVEAMKLSSFAEKISKPVTDVILTLLKWGNVCTINQIINEDLVLKLAQHYNIPTLVKEVGIIDKTTLSEEGLDLDRFETRAPVVVVMGHVDHGKTTLLDFVRKSRVAEKEKGGITQHLGAYEVSTPHGKIVFLDTPGHAAFSKIRMRGAKVADVVILVVAADDSVMPQTIEAIKHAKSMEVPIIVAINKIDKASEKQIERVKQDLAQHDLLVEDWGGQIVSAPISAKMGTGIDHLLEMVSLQSELLELQADKKASARGYILESQLEKGRGPVATLLCNHGTVKVGDFFTCGSTVGKISSLLDSFGNRVKSVGPSTPVRAAGFSALPQAGDIFEVVTQAEYKKARSSRSKPKPSVDSFLSGHENQINIILKVDTKSSQEAAVEAINKLSSTYEKGFHIVKASVGNLNEGDITLAATTNSFIVGLHVKKDSSIDILADKHNVSIKLFSIIYKLIEHLDEVADKLKEIKKVKVKTGQAVVLKVFNIKNLGVIAGCMVKSGYCSRNGILVAMRNNEKIGEGPIKSLQRDKKNVKEVQTGFECAFLVEGFNDWAVDDVVECYIEEEEK